MIQTPKPSARRRSVFAKQIPTMVGLVLLVLGLGIGAFLFTQGTGIFVPRATPETTPQNITVSNVSEDGFTVTFFTTAATSGFVKYGTDPEQLSQAGDQRDERTGVIGEYALHHVPVRGLTPDTTYHYVLGTGKGSLFDDNGKPFTVRTTKRAGTQPRAMSIYGSVTTESDAPAEGAVVFVSSDTAGTLSSLVSNTGSWAVTLSSARLKDGSGFAEMTDDTLLTIKAMGGLPNQKAETSYQVSQKPPVPKLQFGKTTAPAVADSSTDLMGSDGEFDASDMTASTATESSGTPSPTPETNMMGELTDDATDSARTALATTPASPPASPPATDTGASQLGSELAAAQTQPVITVVDLTEATEDEPPIVNTTQPIIRGETTPHARIKVQINSESQIDLDIEADEFGSFEINLADLSRELEPGEHTIEYTATDPTTGQETVRSHTFYVAPRDTSTQLAQANTRTTTTPSPSPSPSPYGTSNPYPYGGGATTSASPRPGATATPSGMATGSAIATPSASPRATASATRSANATSSLIKSGSIDSTVMWIGAGLFFLLAGAWSWWVSRDVLIAENN